MKQLALQMLTEMKFFLFKKPHTEIGCNFKMILEKCLSNN